MQLLIKDSVIKVHCALDIIVRLLHPNYSEWQLQYIKPFLSRAIRTKTGVRINGFEIVGGERGWFYITITNARQQLYAIINTLLERKDEKRNQSIIERCDSDGTGQICCGAETACTKNNKSRHCGDGNQILPETI